MMTELVFIKMFLDRETYLGYRSYVNGDDLDPMVVKLLMEMDSWYRENDKGDPNLNDLYLLCLPKIDKTELLSIFRNLKEMEIPSTALEALRTYKRQRLQEDLSLAALDASQGSEQASRRIEGIIEELNGLDLESTEEDPFVDDDLDAILEATNRKGGLQWRLKYFREVIGNLLPGDFGFIVARPETGKTTLLASEITYMAEQVGVDSGPIIWFNNEEPGRRVVSRLYQSCLGMSDADIRINRATAIETWQKLKGKIKVVDRDPLNKLEIEKICNKFKPSLIILDQIDPIKGFKADREDLRLGAIYEWVRGLAKKYEMPVIGVSQADGSAEGMRYLHMDNTANSKTAKQGAADWIVGIGKVHDPSYENVRYLSAMKSKLTGDHGKREVLIKPDIGRYTDIE